VSVCDDVRAREARERVEDGGLHAVRNVVQVIDQRLDGVLRGNDRFEAFLRRREREQRGSQQRVRVAVRVESGFRLEIEMIEREREKRERT
jgi:hypothetical protein